jgi:hypothetical protein
VRAVSGSGGEADGAEDGDAATRAELGEFYAAYVRGYESLDPEAWAGSFGAPCQFFVTASPDVNGLTAASEVFAADRGQVVEQCRRMLAAAGSTGYGRSRVDRLRIEPHSAAAATIYATLTRFNRDGSVQGRTFGSYHVIRRDRAWGIVSVIGGALPG